MDRFIKYLREKYNPVAMICYGSYRDGTQNDQSDFDALVLTRGGSYAHDTSIVEGVRLDVFVYPRGLDFAPEDVLQIYDGAVITDETGAAAELVRRVHEYVDEFPGKTPEEKTELKNWCEKMLVRAKRGDAEGQYRSHWLLTDSLQIYCDVRDRFYFGPKKTMQRMEKDDPVGYGLLCDAMTDHTRLDSWIKYIFAT